MYSLIYDVKDGISIEKEKRTAKGIAKCAIDKQIRHIHYKQSLFDNKMSLNEMDLIRSENHIPLYEYYSQNWTVILMINGFLKNSINSYAYGHYSIPNVNQFCNIYC